MEHAEAIRTKAAEQYLLGELAGGLREQYEDHFFSCQECAEEVEAGVVFLRAAQEVLGTEKSPKIAPLRAESGIRGSWYAMFLRPALAVTATAILLVIVSYQNVFLIPRMKTEVEQTNTAHTLTSFSLITVNSRGGAPLAIVVSPTKPFGLYLDIPPGNFMSYICEIESESGAPRISLGVSQQEAKETVQLLVPASRLQPGKYFLAVRGLGGSPGTNGEGVEVVRYAFTVNFDNEPNRQTER
jgi:hypothetical protein